MIIGGFKSIQTRQNSPLSHLFNIQPHKDPTCPITLIVSSIIFRRRNPHKLNSRSNKIPKPIPNSDPFWCENTKPAGLVACKRESAVENDANHPATTVPRFKTIDAQILTPNAWHSQPCTWVKWTHNRLGVQNNTIHIIIITCVHNHTYLRSTYTCIDPKHVKKNTWAEYLTYGCYIGSKNKMLEGILLLLFHVFSTSRYGSFVWRCLKYINARLGEQSLHLQSKFKNITCCSWFGRSTKFEIEPWKSEQMQKYETCTAQAKLQETHQKTQKIRRCSPAPLRSPPLFKRELPKFNPRFHQEQLRRSHCLL